MSWTFHLTDIASDQTIVDLTPIALSAQVSPRLNRSCAVNVNAPADDSSLQSVFADGDFKLYPGTRGLKAYQDGALRAHNIVVNCSYSGGTESDPKVLISTLDPMFWLNFRQVWDDTGHIADPTFERPIDAGEMLRQMIRNSTYYDDIVINGVVPRMFPIEVETGTFTTSADMGGFLTDGPQTIGDVVTSLVDTGQVDVVLQPVETSLGYTPGIMGQLNVVPAWGSTRSATFAYDTGAKNVESARRTLGIETLANRITYELGPKIGKDRWKGNITATGPNIPGAYLAMSLASRQKFGVYHQVRVYDDDNDDQVTENDSRPLFMALWKTELLLRSSPRDLLYMKPAASGDNFSVPRPFIDYGIGDIVNVQASAALGHPFAAQQRVYGFDVDIDDMGVERVSELITSADAE